VAIKRESRGIFNRNNPFYSCPDGAKGGQRCYRRTSGEVQYGTSCGLIWVVLSHFGPFWTFPWYPKKVPIHRHLLGYHGKVQKGAKWDQKRPISGHMTSHTAPRHPLSLSPGAQPYLSYIVPIILCTLRVKQLATRCNMRYRRVLGTSGSEPELSNVGPALLASVRDASGARCCFMC